MQTKKGRKVEILILRRIRGSENLERNYKKDEENKQQDCVRTIPPPVHVLNGKNAPGRPQESLKRTKLRWAGKLCRSPIQKYLGEVSEK